MNYLFRARVVNPSLEFSSLAFIKPPSSGAMAEGPSPKRMKMEDVEGSSEEEKGASVNTEIDPPNTVRIIDIYIYIYIGSTLFEAEYFE